MPETSDTYVVYASQEGGGYFTATANPADGTYRIEGVTYGVYTVGWYHIDSELAEHEGYYTETVTVDALEENPTQDFELD